MKTTSTIIIGGGIAGLSTAFHLVNLGQSVTLIEEAQVGKLATSKAAGMITPASEVHLGEDYLMQCFLNCAKFYPQFIERVTNGHTQQVDYQQKGSLICATDHDGEADLTRLTDFQRSMGLEVKEISKTELSEIEPYISPRAIKATYSQNEAHVDNLKLVIALKKYLLASGHCEILENKKVTNMIFSGTSIVSITIGQTETQTLKAERFVLTTGLAHNIAALAQVIKLPMRPVKGQVLTLKIAANTIQRPIRVFHRYPLYLVPRSDGRLVIGATSEELSDQDLTAGAMMDLIYAAWQILPIVYECPVLDMQVGQRPAPIDNKPIVGKTPLDNLYILTGLYRHGIMAAPYLAHELVNLMNNQNTELKWNEFSINRPSLRGTK